MGNKAKKRIRKLLVAAGVLAALVLVVVLLGSILAADLPRRVIREIERRYDVEAKIGETVFSWPATVTFRNVELDRRAGGGTILSVKRVEVRCSLRELLATRVRIEALFADGVVLSLRETDRELVKEEGTGELPDYPIQIRHMDAELQLGAGATPRLAVSGVALMLEPQASGCLALEGGGTSSVFGRFRVSGILGGGLLDTQLAVIFPGVRLGADVWPVLPVALGKLCRESLASGEAVLHASLSWPHDQKLAPANVDVRWRLSVREAAFNIPDVSRPISNVNATIEGTTGDFILRQVSGRYKTSLFAGQGHSLRIGDTFGIQIAGQVRDLELDSEVVKLLPGKPRSAVEALRLERGRIDGDVELRLTPVVGKEDNIGLNLEFLRGEVVLRDGAAAPDET